MVGVADRVATPERAPLMRWPRAGQLRAGKMASRSFGCVSWTVVDLWELFSLGGRCCALGSLAARAT